MSSIIFTSGYLEGDDDLTAMKGHRSDVLFRDDEGFYYELNFINLERLEVEFKSSLEKGENYFSDTGLAILDVIKKDSIVKAVLNLIEKKYFTGQKRFKVEPAEK